MYKDINRLSYTCRHSTVSLCPASDSLPLIVYEWIWIAETALMGENFISNSIMFILSTSHYVPIHHKSLELIDF